MKQIEKLDNLIKSLKITASSQLDERIDILLGQPSAKPKRQENTWRLPLESPFLKYAGAAVLFFVVLLGVNVFPPENNNRVFANVMDRVFKADSVQYKWVVQGPLYELNYTEMINHLCIKRTVLPYGDIIMHDFKTGNSFHLMPGLKCARSVNRTGSNDSRHPFDYLEWISKLHHKDAVYSGQEEIKDKKYNVFTIKHPFEEIKVWVDPQTNLPFRIVIDSLPNPNQNIQIPKMTLTSLEFGGGNQFRTIKISSGPGSSYGIQDRRTLIYSDFQWNIELDDLLFAFEAPADYMVQEKQVNETPKGKNSLIEALKFWTEMSDGKFPDEINDLGDPNKAKPLLIKKFDKDGDPNEEVDQAAEQMHILLQGMYFAQKRKVENNWNYTGKDVNLGAVDTPVCWWKEPGSTEYTMIYADLSIETIPEEEFQE